MSVEKFLGKWTIDSERSEYQLGDPPKQGTYEIVQEENKLTFLMDWIDQADEHKQMSFSEICDGEFHPYEASEAIDEIKLELLDGPILESLAKKGEMIVMTAQRELLSDSLMKVTMGGPLPDGTAYKNVAFYEK